MNKLITFFVTVLVIFCHPAKVEASEIGCGSVLELLDNAEHGTARTLQGINPQNIKTEDPFYGQRSARTLDLTYDPNAMPWETKFLTTALRPAINTATIYLISDLLGRYIESEGGNYIAGTISMFVLLSPIAAAGESVLPITRNIARIMANYLDPEATVIGHLAHALYHLFDFSLKSSVVPLLYTLAVDQAKGNCLSDDPAIRNLGWVLAALGVKALAEEQSNPAAQPLLRGYRHAVAESGAGTPTVEEFLRTKPKKTPSFYLRDFMENITGKTAAVGATVLFFPTTWGFFLSSGVDCETGEPNPVTDLGGFQSTAQQATNLTFITFGLFATQLPIIDRMGRKFGTQVYDTFALGDPLVALPTIAGIGVTTLAGISFGDRAHAITESMGILSGAAPFVGGVQAALSNQLPTTFALVCTGTNATAPLFEPAALSVASQTAPEFTGSYETALGAHGFYPPKMQGGFQAAGIAAAMVGAPWVIDAGRRLLEKLYSPGPSKNRLRLLAALNLIIPMGHELKPGQSSVVESSLPSIGVMNPMQATGYKTGEEEVV